MDCQRWRASGVPDVVLLRYFDATPTNERQSLERELREELPALLAAYQQELAAGQADKTRRD